MNQTKTLDIPTAAVTSVERALRAVGARVTDKHATAGACGYTTITVEAAAR